MEYIYKQLELDGIFISDMDKTGTQYVTTLGKNTQDTKKKLKKKDILEMLYKSRNI
jgi:hypothetical protein